MKATPRSATRMAPFAFEKPVPTSGRLPSDENSRDDRKRYARMIVLRIMKKVREL